MRYYCFYWQSMLTLIGLTGLNEFVPEECQVCIEKAVLAHPPYLTMRIQHGFQES